MKKKIVSARQLHIYLTESKKVFKFAVNNDTRLKELANKMASSMNLSPFSTEWTFYDAYQDLMIPLMYTLRQIEMQHNIVVSNLVASVRSIDILDNQPEDIITKLRPFNHFTQTMYKPTEMSIQVNSKEEMKKQDFDRKKQLFSVNGYQRPTLVPNPCNVRPPKTINQLKKHAQQNIWEKVKDIKEAKILRGFNIVGYCSNERCPNHERLKLVSLGFCSISSEYLHNKVFCESCPHKCIQKNPIIILGIVLKECKWNVHGFKSNSLHSLAISTMEKYGKEMFVKGIKKIEAASSIFKNQAEIEYCIKPIGSYHLRGGVTKFFY